MKHQVIEMNLVWKCPVDIKSFEAKNSFQNGGFNRKLVGKNV